MTCKQHAGEVYEHVKAADHVREREEGGLQENELIMHGLKAFHLAKCANASRLQLCSAYGQHLQ